MLNVVCVACLLLLLVCVPVTLYGQFRHHRSTWGGTRYMYSRLISLSGGEAAIEWNDDYPDPMPFVPAWSAGEEFDFDVDLWVVRTFRTRQSIYAGERPDPPVPVGAAMPGIVLSRHSVRVRFNHLALASLPPLGLWLVMNRRWLLQRARPAPGRCAGCGYDLRATPQRCPECGRAARAASDVTGPGRVMPS